MKIKNINNTLIWGLISIVLICSWYLLWFIYPHIIKNILIFINSPKFIWFLSIIFISSFIYLIYLIIKEGFNKETLLKFWRWTDKTIIVRFYIYLFIFILIVIYIILPLRKYFDLININLVLMVYGRGATDKEVIDYQIKYRFNSLEGAKQNLRFLRNPLYRSYACVYPMGRQLVHNYVSAGMNQKERFLKLLQEQLIPSQLKFEKT